MMKIRDYVLSDENIFHAIYSLDSYILNRELLSQKDVILFYSLKDVFNYKLVTSVISKVKSILRKVLCEDDFFFECEVFFKPKKYQTDNNKPVFRPLHTSDLLSQISMICLLNAIIYELPNGDRITEHDSVSLSDLANFIPENFYGNKISTDPKHVFIPWVHQYNRYIKKETGIISDTIKNQEEVYEIKLDLINFFPSVNPMILFNYMVSLSQGLYTDNDDMEVFKTIIYKLMVCRITNLSTSEAVHEYYNNDINLTTQLFTRGIPQGLPQASFFW